MSENKPLYFAVIHYARNGANKDRYAVRHLQSFDQPQLMEEIVASVSSLTRNGYVIRALQFEVTQSYV